jgi:hypothetical protein
MSEPLPEDSQGPAIPEPEARSPVSLPVQGTAPAWDDSSQQLPDGEQPAHETGPREFVHAFGLQREGGITSTAERIGSAVGNAQREVRRRLELVRRAPGALLFSSSGGVAEAAEHASQLAREGVEHASHVVQEIEEEVFDFRKQVAHKLDELSALAEGRVLEFRRQVRDELFRSRERVRELADRFPLRTIAGIAGVCFALGVALRFRRYRRG